MGPVTPHIPGNFNYELSTLRLLEKMNTMLTTGTLRVGAPGKYTPAVSRETTPGTITEGARSISITNTGLSDALIQGVTLLKPTENLSFSVSFPGEYLSAFDYDPQSSELLVLVLAP